MRRVIAVASVSLFVVGSLPARPADREALVSALQPSRIDVQSAGDEVTLEGISASRSLQAMLDRSRRALGGKERLRAVKSLRIDGRLTVEGLPPPTFLRKVLLPDRFQEVRSGTVFTIVGTRYSQEPEPNEASRQMAERAITATFVEQTLLLLIRAPARAPLHAATTSAVDGRGTAVAFTGGGGFERIIEFDPSSLRPTAYSSRGSLTRAGETTSGTRRVVVEAFRQVEGIWFPVRFLLRQEGITSAIRIEFDSVTVNHGVSAADFEQRR